MLEALSASAALAGPLVGGGAELPGGGPEALSGCFRRQGEARGC